MSNTLQVALKKKAAPPREAARPAKPKQEKESGKAEGSRAGRVLIGGHFDVSVRKRLLMIRAQHPDNPTMQGLLEEALDLLFDHYKQPRLR